MRNWAVDTSKINKESDAFAIWKLEQLINFGLAGEKIQTSKLKKYFNRLALDPSKKRFITFLLSHA